MEKQKFKAVILGSDIGSYSIARTVYEHYNQKSLIVCKSKSWMTYYSKIVDNVIVDNMTEKKLLNTLISIGKKNKDVKLLIFGCSEDYVEIISRNKEKLSEYYVIPYVDIKTFSNVVEKKNFYKACESLGIRYPHTLIVNKKNYKKIKIPFSFPMIAKPSNRAQYTRCHFDGKRKVYIITSYDHLMKCLDNLYNSTYDDEFILQEYIVGEDANMRVLTCFCDQNSDVIFSRVGQVLLEEKGANATGNYTSIINTQDDNIVNDAKRFLKKSGYVGYANFDIKYNDIDGHYYFFELNVRLGRSNFYMANDNFNYLKPLIDSYIYNEKYKDTNCDVEELYTVVPSLIIKKYVKDKNLIKKSIKLKKNYPLWYKKDLNLTRIMYIILARINFLRKYRKNYEQ